MKQKSLSVALIFILGMFMVVGMVWALSAGVASSQTAPTKIVIPEQREAVHNAVLWAGAASSQTAPTKAAATGNSVADQRDVARNAVHWLIGNHQNDDGGYAYFSAGANQDPSDVRSTMDAILAISAAGYNPAANFPGKTHNPVAFLQNNPADMADYASDGGGPAGKVILSLAAANQDPRDFLGYNFVISLTEQLSSTGQYATTPLDQSLALLGLSGVNETVPLSATQLLKNQQATNGSWDDGFGTASNADASGMAVMALIANDEPLTSTSLISATTFFRDAQLLTGGWEYGPGSGENANSTALVVQALSALGEEFYSAGGPWDKSGNTPLSALLAWQNDTGAFQSDIGLGLADNFFTTAQSIPAATGKPYPLPGRYEAARQAIACLATLQDTATGGWEQFAGSGVNAGGTSRAIEAIAAFGDDPQSAEWTPGSVNAVEALENLTPDYLAGERGGRAGIIMQGVTAAGQPYTVTNFAGFNLPISMTTFLSPTGEYDNTAFQHDEAMLGLIVSGYEPDSSAVSWLKNEAVGGTWGFADVDGLSINVLGRLGESVPGSISNLHDTQLADGGWGFGPLSDPSSTSEVVQGPVQNEENPFAPAWSVVVSGTIQSPADVILSQQLTSGCWPAFAGGDGPFATMDAIIMLMQEPGWKSEEVYLPAILK